MIKFQFEALSPSFVLVSVKETESGLSRQVLKNMVNKIGEKLKYVMSQAMLHRQFLRSSTLIQNYKVKLALKTIYFSIYINDTVLKPSFGQYVDLSRDPLLLF